MIMYSARSDIGYSEIENRVNEDFVHIKEILTPEGEKLYFGVVADGIGSLSSQFQPSILASIQIEEVVERLCNNNFEEFITNPKPFLQEALVAASYTLGTFRMVDEQRYGNFATSLSCVLIYKGKLVLAHSGNTRINLIRYSKKLGAYDVKQITKDHTKGMELVEQGKLTYNEYHIHPTRLEITGGLGVSAMPKIQVFDTTLKDNDFILLTSDGIHNAIRPDVMFNFIQASKNCDEVTEALIQAAKSERYEDNMSVILFWNYAERK